MQSSEVQGLGQLLQQARERKGVTLTEAQQATKIRYSFLQAIEGEDFTVLPPKVYARGFIKIYATYIDLEPKPKLQLYDETVDGYSVYPVQAVPSADSGGQTLPPALRGLTQGEMRTIEPSDSRFQTTFINATGSNADTVPATRAIVPVFQRRQETALVHNPEQIVLPRVMLKDTKGAFYIPNFAPVLFVAVIILTAVLLLYRGITSQNSDGLNTAQGVVSATQTSGLNSTARITQNAVTTTRTPMTPPPYQGASINSGQITAASSIQQPPPAPSRAIGQGGVGLAATTPPAEAPATQAPVTAPPAANVKVEVVIGNSDARGSWLTVWVDDQQVLARIASPGEKLNYEGKKVAVRAGNPGVIIMRVNGADREYTKPGTGVITRTVYGDGRPDTVEN